MIQTLLIVAIVILACVFLDKVSERFGVPMLLAFILLGMFFGSDGVVKIAFDNYQTAEELCSIALIFIMFYGGFGTNWREARPVAAKAVLLSTVGVVMTAGLTGWLCHTILHFDWLESLLLGALLSSTDAASVFSVLRSRKLNLKYRTASLLEVESGSNDPCAYMLTVIFLTMEKGSMDGITMLGMIAAQVLLGVVCGAFCAWIAVKMLQRDEFPTDGFDVIFTVGMAVLAYALSVKFGGNGYLSVYILGIILGNSEFSNKPGLVHFFDGLTGLMQILIFFLLGLLAFPSRLPAVFFPALVIALLLTFIVRPLVVSVILIPFGSSFSQIALVSWSGLRGAASIVFAIMAERSLTTTIDIYHIVFLIVIFSILMQGSMIPFMAKLTGMIDEKENVMKTFNDYTKLHLIERTLDASHPYAGLSLAELPRRKNELIIMIERNGEIIIPNGDVVLQPDDMLVINRSKPHV